MIRLYDWKENIKNEELKDAINALKNGELIVFPTETVYGIGADGFNSFAIKKIYEAKGRPADNPLILHVSDFKMLEECVSNISEVERKLIDAFMPGPFTLILDKKDIVPSTVTANLSTVAVRMPNNKIANTIIKKFGKPIAAPSANVSGKPSGTNIEDIKEELGEKVFALIDGGNTDIGLESTVVKVIGDIPTILRPGKITADDIKNIVGQVRIDSHVLNDVSEDEKVESPGMKHKHYAPKTKCVLIDIQDDEMRINKINELLKDDVCVIGFESHKDKINTSKFFSMGESLEDVSKNIFSLLRKVDNLNCSLIIIEGVKLDGLGLAIMNRLIRTCNYNVISEKSSDEKQ